jgi:hypothetical protein
VTLENQIAYAQAHLDGATVIRQPDGIYVIRWPFEPGAPWNPSTLTMIVLVPPLFPSQAPSGFDTLGSVARPGTAIGGVGMRQMGDEQWMHFCWNPSGALDYTLEDAIWRFAKFAESRFLSPQ